MSVDYILVFVAVGNSSEAKAIAHKLVEQREAACVGILKQNSIYRWEGKNIEDDEYLLTIKTT